MLRDIVLKVNCKKRGVWSDCEEGKRYDGGKRSRDPMSYIHSN
jgi:hypothetical protein